MSATPTIIGPDRGPSGTPPPAFTPGALTPGLKPSGPGFITPSPTPSSVKNDLKSVSFVSSRASIISFDKNPTPLVLDPERGAPLPDDHVDIDLTDAVAVRAGMCKCADLSTQRGRRNHALMIMLVSVVPVVALLIQNSIDIYDQNNDLILHALVKKQIMFSTQIGDLTHMTQKERGKTAIYIGSNGNPDVYKDLIGDYMDTDKAIEKLSYWVAEEELPQFQSPEAYHAHIRAFRNGLNVGGKVNKTIADVVEFYSQDDEIMQGWVGDTIQFSKSGELWKTLVAYYMLILAKEQAGVERALGSTYFTMAGFTDYEKLMYLKHEILGGAYLDRCKEYSRLVVTYLEDKFYERETADDLMELRREIILHTSPSTDLERAEFWFDTVSDFVDELKVMQDTLGDNIIHGLEKEVVAMTEALIESSAVMAIALILFPCVIIAVNKLTHRIQAFAMSLQEKSADLDNERKRSEALLYELLPKTIAKKLLNHQEIKSVTYPATTIFFSDMVGFTAICSRSTAMQVIDMLNTLYRLFDECLERYDVYKVETIGDAYMVASGVPNENLEGHATEIGSMALDIKANINNMPVPHLPDEKIKLRIGINSGPVVAGVVGQKMPRYCLFGDTVTVASKMEQTSVPQKIQITELTKFELDRKGGYIISERGKVEIKGKGKVTTYWLDGKKKEDEKDDESEPEADEVEAVSVIEDDDSGSEVPDKMKESRSDIDENETQNHEEEEEEEEE